MFTVHNISTYSEIYFEVCIRFCQLTTTPPYMMVSTVYDLHMCLFQVCDLLFLFTVPIYAYTHPHKDE